MHDHLLNHHQVQKTDVLNVRTFQDSIIEMATSAVTSQMLNASNSTNGTTNELEFTTILYPAMLVTVELWKYLGIIIVLLGTVGHILSIAVLIWSKKMRGTASTVYLVAMSLAGMVSLYTGLLRYNIYIGFSDWQYDLRNDSIFACRFHIMLTYLSLQYFAWLQATVAVDRLISLLVPHNYKTLCTWKTGLIVTLVELVVLTALNSAVPATVSHDENGECVYTNPEFFQNGWGYIDLVSFSLLPAAIMIPCNSVILVIFNKSTMTHQKGRNSKSRSLTVMLLSLNVIFVITTLPISIVFFVPWGEWGTPQYADSELAWTIFSLLQYAGSACTFLVYCITGSKFREELLALLKTMFHRKSSKVGNARKSTMNVTTVSRIELPEVSSISAESDPSSNTVSKEQQRHGHKNDSVGLTPVG